MDDNTNQAVAEEEFPKDYVKLADETILDCSAGYDGDVTLWVWTNDGLKMNFAQALAIFSDTTKTTHIETYHRESLIGSYDGFTRLYTIRQNESGKIDIGLRKAT